MMDKGMKKDGFVQTATKNDAVIKLENQVGVLSKIKSGIILRSFLRKVSI